MSNKVLVIGAQNIDIFTKTKTPYTLKDSNICDIRLAFGGVGRNIAENLRRLHNNVSFLTVFSDDHFSQAAKQSLESMNIDVSQSIIAKGYTNSIYLGILDDKNDLYLGLNDMKIVEELNQEAVQSRIDYINSFDVVVIDNNLSINAIRYLLESIEGIKVMDAVSAHKIDKLQNLLSHIDYLKVNEIEFQRLQDLCPVIPSSLHLLITNGSKEITYIYNKNTKQVTPIKVTDVINASGAGDGFISGFVHGILLNVEDELKIEYAKKVAYYTLLSEDATNKELDKIEVKI